MPSRVYLPFLGVFNKYLTSHRAGTAVIQLRKTFYPPNKKSEASTEIEPANLGIRCNHYTGATIKTLFDNNCTAMWTILDLN